MLAGLPGSRCKLTSASSTITPEVGFLAPLRSHTRGKDLQAGLLRSVVTSHKRPEKALASGGSWIAPPRDPLQPGYSTLWSRAKVRRGASCPYWCRGVVRLNSPSPVWYAALD